MKKLISLLVAGAALLAVSGNAAAKPAMIFTDPAGDAGTDASGPMPGLDQAGFDLTGGTIDTVGKDVIFTVTHAAMPSSNQPGEAFRFLWHFDIGKKQYRFTVKTLDVGKPDAVAQSGTERVGQVYANGVARLEEGYTDTSLPLTLSQFHVLAYYDVTFDAAKKTMTWKMPMADLKLKPGSTIASGTGGSTSTGCQICWIPHYAERSLTPSTIIDASVMTTGYKIPR